MRKMVPECPAAQNVRQICRLSRNLTRALGRLHQELSRCRQCDLGDDCPLLDQFYAQVDTAIQEVVREWEA